MSQPDYSTYPETGRPPKPLDDSKRPCHCGMLTLGHNVSEHVEHPIARYRREQAERKPLDLRIPRADTGEERTRRIEWANRVVTFADERWAHGGCDYVQALAWAEVALIIRDRYLADAERETDAEHCAGERG